MRTKEAMIQLLAYGKSVYNQDTDILYVYKFVENNRNGIVTIYKLLNEKITFLQTFEDLDYLDLFELYTTEYNWEFWDDELELL